MYGSKPRVAFASILCVLFVSVPAQAQEGGPRVLFEHEDYQEAVREADARFDGALFLYFYTPGHESHKVIHHWTFENDPLARYVNEHFARMAVDTSTPEGAELLRMFRPDEPGWPFVMLVEPREDNRHTGMHGWENFDFFEEGEAEQWIDRLAMFKNQPARERAFEQEGLTPAEAYQQLEERGLVEESTVDSEAFLSRIEAGDAEAVQLFLAVGISPNAADHQGRQALLLAADRGHAEVVETLVEAGADVSVKDKVGRTPLMLAVEREHDAVVQVLLAAQQRP